MDDKITDNYLMELAGRLEQFQFDFDTYEYKDNLEVNETREDVVNQIYDSLHKKDYISQSIEFLSGVIEEMESNYDLYVSVKELLNELKGLEIRDKKMSLESQIVEAKKEKDNQIVPEKNVKTHFFERD